MVIIEISKSQLVEYMEEDPTLQYMGDIQVGTEQRSYYRTAIDAGDTTQGYKIVYIVE